MKRTARFNDIDSPLITVILHNNNNEKYLEECFNSILNQTYDNIEIIFYDFASTDNSWKIANEYQKDNPGIFTLLHFRKDYFLDKLVDTLQNVRGRYFIRFHTNSKMHPALLEKSISALENNYEVAFAKIRTVTLLENDREIINDPLYEKTCVVQGTEHIKNHIIINPRPFSSISVYNTDFAKLSNTSFEYVNEAQLCLKYNMVYIREPLFFSRKSKNIFLPNENANLTHIFELYNTKIFFIERLYNILEMEEILEKLSEATITLSRFCLAHSVTALSDGNENDAKKFFHLSTVIDLDITIEDTYLKLEKFWESDNEKRREILNELKTTVKISETEKTLPIPPNSKSLRL